MEHQSFTLPLYEELKRSYGENSRMLAKRLTLLGAVPMSARYVLVKHEGDDYSAFAERNYGEVYSGKQGHPRKQKVQVDSGTLLVAIPEQFSLEEFLAKETLLLFYGENIEEITASDAFPAEDAMFDPSRIFDWRYLFSGTPESITVASRIGRDFVEDIALCILKLKPEDFEDLKSGAEKSMMLHNARYGR